MASVRRAAQRVGAKYRGDQILVEGSSRLLLDQDMVNLVKRAKYLYAAAKKTLASGNQNAQKRIGHRLEELSGLLDEVGNDAQLPYTNKTKFKPTFITPRARPSDTQTSEVPDLKNEKAWKYWKDIYGLTRWSKRKGIPEPNTKGDTAMSYYPEIIKAIYAPDCSQYRTPTEAKTRTLPDGRRVFYFRVPGLTRHGNPTCRLAPLIETYGSKNIQCKEGHIPYRHPKYPWLWRCQKKTDEDYSYYYVDKYRNYKTKKKQRPPNPPKSPKAPRGKISAALTPLTSYSPEPAYQDSIPDWMKKMAKEEKKDDGKVRILSESKAFPDIPLLFKASRKTEEPESKTKSARKVKTTKSGKETVEKSSPEETAQPKSGPAVQKSSQGKEVTKKSGQQKSRLVAKKSSQGKKVTKKSGQQKSRPVAKKSSQKRNGTKKLSRAKAQNLENEKALQLPSYNLRNRK